MRLYFATASINKTITSILASIVFMMGSLSAAVVDFEGYGYDIDIGGSYSSHSYQAFFAGWTSNIHEGFSFYNPTNDHYYIPDTYQTDDSHPYLYSDTDYVVSYLLTDAQTGDNYFEIYSTNGELFNIYSFDYGVWNDQNTTNSFVAKGFRNGVEIASVQFTTDNLYNDIDQDGNDFNHVDVVGFENLTHLTFTKANGTLDNFLALDNIEYEFASVPEPSTYALLALGLIGLGVYRKRNKKNNS